MQKHDDDIIAAIASGQVEAAIGVIRVSGKGCLNLLEKVFSKKQPYEHRRIYYGFIKDRHGEVIDEVLVSVHRAPKSYTGEDSFEINSHGGLVCMNQIMERLFEVGARLAEPGEFTKRAFLNGKIDLSQAEAVAKIIAAKTDRALRVAERQLQGQFKSTLDEIREKILLLMAENEVRIDHPEEELSDLTLSERLKMVREIRANLKKLYRAARYGNNLFKGMVLAIVGKPNVGKSSLLNLIVGQESAIVTNIPGTTRDIVKESFSIKGIPFSILDTAGIRNTNNTVEKIGVERSLKAIDEADIILAVFDGSSRLTDEDFNLIEKLKETDNEIVAVINKADLEQRIELSALPFQHKISISCKTGEGLEKLEEKLEEIALRGFSDKELISLNASQMESLKKAIILTDKLEEDISSEIDPALIGVDFLSLTDYLDEVIGRITNEEMLDVMFKNFCIGK